MTGANRQHHIRPSGRIVMPGNGDQVEIAAPRPTGVHHLDQSTATVMLEPAGQRRGATTGGNHQSRAQIIQLAPRLRRDAAQAGSTQQVMPAAALIVADLQDRKGLPQGLGHA